MNAPKDVWLSEDGTGIVQKVTYDPITNQLVGLVLPFCEKSGMPMAFSYTPQSFNEIKKQINENKKSTHLYLILEQPIKDNIPPFILQAFGTDNTFKTHHVLSRWQHINDQLKR